MNFAQDSIALKLQEAYEEKLENRLRDAFNDVLDRAYEACRAFEERCRHSKKFHVSTFDTVAAAPSMLRKFNVTSDETVEAVAAEIDSFLLLYGAEDLKTPEDRLYAADRMKTTIELITDIRERL
jgi:hypothetical protein